MHNCYKTTGVTFLFVFGITVELTFGLWSIDIIAIFIRQHSIESQFGCLVLALHYGNIIASFVPFCFHWCFLPSL